MFFKGWLSIVNFRVHDDDDDDDDDDDGEYGDGVDVVDDCNEEIVSDSRVTVILKAFC